MLQLIFNNQAELPSAHEDFFTPLLRETEKLIPDITETEVEFNLVDDPTIQKINKETRGLNKPTDVLSFANREIIHVEGVAPEPDDSNSLGQIFISWPAAERNADEMNQSLEEELRFLFVHGLLHILGYDHQTKFEETEMMTLAYKILGRPPY